MQSQETRALVLQGGRSRIQGNNSPVQSQSGAFSDWVSIQPNESLTAWKHKIVAIYAGTSSVIGGIQHGGLNLQKFLRLAEVKESLKNVQGLDDGWNGLGSKKVVPSLIALTELILGELASGIEDFEVPFVAPLHNGSLQFEWESGSRSTEIEAIGSEWKIITKEMELNGRPSSNVKSVLLTDISALLECYHWVYRKI